MDQSVNSKEADIVMSNYYQYYQAFARSGIVEYHEGPVCWIKPKEGEHGPSLAFRIRLDGDQAEEQLQVMIKGIKEKKIPDLWHVTPDAMPKDILSLLEENGFRNMAPADAEPEPTMLLYQKDFCPYVQKESNIQRRVVRTKEDFRAWVKVVNTALHGWDMIDAEHYYAWVQSEDIRIYLCEIDGFPVATAATICNGDMASLEFVSTLEAYRRKGAAISLCSVALNDLWECGVNVVTLGACEESPALYKKLGFHNVYYNVIMKYDGLA